MARFLRAIAVAAALATSVSAIDPPRPPTQPVGGGERLITYQESRSGAFAASSRAVSWVDGTDDGRYIFANTAGLVFEDIVSGESETFVPASALPADYRDYRIRPDLKKVLFATNDTKQYRHSFFADYQILDVESGELTPLVADQAGDIQHAEFAPAGDAIAFVRGNNLYLNKGGDVTQVTNDGGPDLFHGVPDWVYEEEIFGDKKALWFSPDGEYVAYLSFDETGVETFTIPYYMDGQKTAPVYPRELDLRYPKVGTKNPTVKFSLLEVDSGESTTLEDQVDALRRRGIAAECIDSTKSWEEIQDINAALRSGKLRMIYCAPERLNNEMFVENMKHVRGGVRLLAVDEAHCISEWGHSFRPDYLKVARFVDEIKAEKVICLTATATPVVADDICNAFSISKDGVFRTSPYRPNLRLEAVAISKQEEKRDLLLAYLKKHKGSTLVYVTQQRQAEDLALELRKQGFKVQAFHAGMKTEEKTRIQDAFMASKVDIVVATIAFGMGIDKSDIRSIIHWDLSNTVEEYCQQVGRAGRDGKESHCMLYLCPEDLYVKEAFARGDLPSRQSLRGLLKDIFRPEVLSLSVGDTFKTSHHPQTTEFDIRMSPLSIIYAALELRFKLIRAITPEYSSYTFEANNVYYPRLKNDKSPEAAAILNNAKKAKKYHSIDPTAVSKSTSIRRNDLIKYLNMLNDTGCIKLKVSGVQNKYKILSKLPGTDREIDELVEKVYADLELREQQALDRTQQLIKLVRAKKCFALSLAQHFGMELPGQATQCGHCTFCVTKKAVELPAPARKPFDFEAAEKVLEATDVRDDPRFLARVAFGIKSPRVTRLGLDKKKIFASMAESDFEALLAEFTKVCK
ncbi:hypothetical protein BN1723_013084 [Verticillium longisporum]|uniref:DNA 3'-5' helicase n=2 Tax=Verticillium longisporum TaxID=100787 RepID=A0A0G4LNQ9_VERLO|nr:hypothetical protein BN1723_013084 [Verticillium longisporum]